MYECVRELFWLRPCVFYWPPTYLSAHSLTHSLTRSLTHSLTPYSLAHPLLTRSPLTHSLAHPLLTHSLTPSRKRHRGLSQCGGRETASLPVVVVVMVVVTMVMVVVKVVKG